MDITLSPDQEHAADNILMVLLAQAREDAILVGAAGCGKTTLMRYLAHKIETELGRSCSLYAPTGKAATRLSQVTGRTVETIHKGLYPRVHRDTDGRLAWRDPQQLCGRGQIVIIDEASMVGRDLYEDIHRKLPNKAQVLYVGDREQLMPVNDSWGPALEVADGVLTQVHRQSADNPILAYATAIREGRGKAWYDAYDNDNSRLQSYDEYTAALHWSLDQYSRNRDATILTYTNPVRHRLNAEIRAGLGRRGVLVPGDKLLVRVNNRDIGVMNGEVVTVQSCFQLDAISLSVETTEGIVFKLNLDFFNREKSDFIEWKQKYARREPDWVHCDYGYALTIHASQGSEWQNVCVVLDKPLLRRTTEEPEEGRRMVYTAVTRAAERLAIVRLF